jgi:hypothetical protein
MSVELDGRVFVDFFFSFFKQSIRELCSSLVGGCNPTFTGCQPPLNLIEVEARF